MRIHRQSSDHCEVLKIQFEYKLRLFLFLFMILPFLATVQLCAGSKMYAFVNLKQNLLNKLGKSDDHFSFEHSIYTHLECEGRDKFFRRLAHIAKEFDMLALVGCIRTLCPKSRRAILAFKSMRIGMNDHVLPQQRPLFEPVDFVNELINDSFRFNTFVL